MNRESVDKFLEHAILALVLAILVIGPVALGAVDPWEFLTLQSLTVVVLLLWMARLWLSPKPRLLWPPIAWAVLAFALYAVGRYFTADLEFVARQELIRVLVCAALFFVIVNNLYRQEFAPVISFTLIALAMVLSCVALYQFATHHWNVWGYVGQYPGRATATYISPNHFCGFLEMIFPLTLAYLLVGRIKPLTRILLGYCALTIGAGIVVTFSRGGWAAASAGTAVLLGVLVFNRHHRLPALLLLLAFLGGGAVLLTKYLPQTASYIQREHASGMKPGEISLEVRGDIWHAALRMWRDHFWFGVGPAHYNYRYRVYRSPKDQLSPDLAHNDYLNLLADWGTVGGIVVAAGMTAFAAGLYQTRKHVQRPDKTFGSGFSNRHALFLGASCGLLALSLHSIVDFNLHIPANAILGTTLLALVSSNLRFATEKFWVTARLPLRLACSLFLLAGSVYLVASGVRTGREETWVDRADAAPNYSPVRAAALEKAFAIEPNDFRLCYGIGECDRTESFLGGDNSDSLAEAAMEWYARGMKLNPFDPDNYFRYGMCLDWLGRHGEAEKYFWDAEARDPNSYFLAANFGWHYFQAGDYAAARSCFVRSLTLEPQPNPIASDYLRLTEQRLADEAAGKILFPGL